MRILRVIDRITDGAAMVGIAAIPPLVGIMVWEVFSRYALNRPTIWAFELSWMLMGVIFIMGVAYALRRREHVNVDLANAFLTVRQRAAIEALSYLLLLPCVAWITRRMFTYAVNGYLSGEVSGVSAWNPVVWPFRAILFLGLLVFSLQIVAELIRAVHCMFYGPKGQTVQ